MLHAFFVQHYPYLSLIHNPTGNYYTVVTEEDLTKLSDNLCSPKHRLVFRGTQRELMVFANQKQLELPLETKTDAPPSPN